MKNDQSDKNQRLIFLMDSKSGYTNLIRGKTVNMKFKLGERCATFFSKICRIRN